MNDAENRLNVALDNSTSFKYKARLIGKAIKSTKCVQGYGFLSFARKFGDKYGKKLMNSAAKAGTKCCKNYF